MSLDTDMKLLKNLYNEKLKILKEGFVIKDDIRLVDASGSEKKRRQLRDVLELNIEIQRNIEVDIDRTVNRILSGMRGDVNNYIRKLRLAEREILRLSEIFNYKLEKIIASS